jgi:5-methylcytosine-specific restriction endonuclease McrA
MNYHTARMIYKTRYIYQPPTIAYSIKQTIERLLEVTHSTTKSLDYNSEFWRELSRQIKIRDCWRCTSCKDNRHLEVHHRVPLKYGGTNAPSNLITLCSKCHHARHQAQLRKAQYE